MFTVVSSVGDVILAHRVVLAPLTRQRATTAHRPTVLGSLLISEENILVTTKAGVKPHILGIWNDAQIVAWKQITDDEELSFPPLFSFSRQSLDVDGIERSVSSLGSTE
ncbi:12-oxophytodienoate reductase 3 [Grifola frondosa]|uniref:12-oxophytodienoate reductase 3 n=1 Tax=Grifola frondosa TaxID=5627 RepID=A0A1C7LMU1_GRIFR|nr:12-oxophytodienoate reductase 3 [Grifola frondosa]